MHIKKCSKCLKDLDLSNYYMRKTGHRSGEYYEKCKDCMKDRGRNYYHANHDRQLKLALIRRHRAYLEKRSFLIEYKNKPCLDCGIKYPFYVMDLDHRDFKNKVNNVSRMFTANWSLEKIKNEASKCDVVCANCHRIRTYKKFNSKKLNAEIAKVVTAEL